MIKNEVEQLEDIDLSIDQYALDKEWMEQPKMFWKYSAMLAKARITEDEASQQLKLVEAEIQKDVRENPGEYGLVKTTEKEIADCVLRQPEYKMAIKKLNNAKYDVQLLFALTQALDQRRRALENLVSLHGQEYFAEPRVKDEDAAEGIKEINKKGARQRVKFSE